MYYSTFLPTNRLSGYVRFFWVLEGGELGNPYVYRSMADSCAELLFHYKGTFDEIDIDDRSTGSFLSGIHSQSQRYRRFVTNERFGIFGAYLYPYAARRLFDLSPEELTGYMPDLHSALGKKGKELEEKIMLAPDNQARYRILAYYLEKQLRVTPEDDHPVRSAVGYVIHAKRKHSVRELAQQFNISERQFERKFKEYAGFNPKLYMRIIRFEEVCRCYGYTDQKTLTDIAYECGYYDQSHFIHDFKAFSGYHPKVYFRGNAEGTEWRDS